MDIFYQFDDDIRTAHVLVPWMIAKDLKPGTPLTETGEVANDDTAYGLLINAGDVGEGVVKRNLGGGMTEVLPSQTVTTNDGDPASQPLSNNGDLNIVAGTPATFTLDVNGYTEDVTFRDDGWYGTSIALQVVQLGEVPTDLVFLFNDEVHDFYGDVTIAGYVEVDENDIIPKQTVSAGSSTPWKAGLSNVNLDVYSPVPESFTLSINGETETLTLREWEFDSIKTYSWEGPHYSVKYMERWNLMTVTPEDEEHIPLPNPCVVSGYTGEGDSPLASPLLCINCEVMIAGYCDEKAAEASCGLEYTDALKGALSDIVFADGKVSFGESGGGSEPTKTVYIPEQTVSLTDYGNFSAYVLTNVTLNAQSGTPSTITLSVDGTTEELTNEGAGWAGENYSIDNADDIWRLYSRSASPSSSVTVSAYTIEESGGESGGGGGEVTTGRVKIVVDSTYPSPAGLMIPQIVDGVYKTVAVPQGGEGYADFPLSDYDGEGTWFADGVITGITPILNIAVSSNVGNVSIKAPTGGKMITIQAVDYATGTVYNDMVVTVSMGS